MGGVAGAPRSGGHSSEAKKGSLFTAWGCEETPSTRGELGGQEEGRPQPWPGVEGGEGGGEGGAAEGWVVEEERSGGGRRERQRPSLLPLERLFTGLCRCWQVSMFSAPRCCHSSAAEAKR